MKNFKLGFIVMGITLILSCSKTEQVMPKSNKEYSDIERIEPPNWWVGMKDKSLQLLVHHQGISE